MGRKPNFWAIFGSFSYFSAIFFLFSGGGQNQCFSYFFPISGRRLENPVLAAKGGLGRWVAIFDKFRTAPILRGPFSGAPILAWKVILSSKAIVEILPI